MLRTSLHNRIKGKVVCGAKPRPFSVEEETELAEFAIETASVGCRFNEDPLFSEGEKDILKVLVSNNMKEHDCLIVATIIRRNGSTAKDSRCADQKEHDCIQGIVNAVD